MPVNVETANASVNSPAVYCMEVGLDDLLPFMQDMVKDIYQEVAFNPKHTPLDPDYASYRDLQDKGLFLLYRMDVDEELAGYAGFFFIPNLKSKGQFNAVNDFIHVKKQYRKREFTGEFFRFLNDDLTEAGADQILFNSKVFNDFGKSLEPLGYKWVEKVYLKQVGV